MRGIFNPADSRQSQRRNQDETLLSDASVYTRMGLCANCLNVTACGFPDARQGVLQCEEYLLDEAGVIPPMEPKQSRSAA